MDITNDLEGPFSADDFKDDILKSTAIFDRLDKVLGRLGWEVNYQELEEMFSCTITICVHERTPISKTGLGATIAEARADAASLWGMPVVYKEPLKEKLPPKVDAPKTATEKPKSVWTDKRSEAMRDIKSKLRITENEQFGPHLNKWSEGKAESIKDLNEKNVDGFIKYMMDNYVNLLSSTGKASSPSVSNSTEEVF